MASFNELQDLNHTLRVTAVTVLNSGLAGKKLAEVENEKNYLNAILQVGVFYKTTFKNAVTCCIKFLDSTLFAASGNSGKLMHIVCLFMKHKLLYIYKNTFRHVCCVVLCWVLSCVLVRISKVLVITPHPKMVLIVCSYFENNFFVE